MADNLEIFGETYPNATGIKAKDTNGVTQTFVKPSGTVNITSSGTTDVSAYANASVAAGAVTAPSTISGTSATVSTGTNTLTLSKTVSVTPNVTTAGYISSGTAGNASVSLTASVNTRNSSSLSASGATVTAPAGYYASDASKAVASGSATAPATISGSSATVSTGTNTLTLSKTVSVTPTVSAGYVSSGTAGNSSVSLTASVTTKGAATITPSTTQQTIASGTYLTGTQTIAAMPSGTAGTPTATKGTVSNHSITVTPSVTNTTGYITGGTKTGTAVSVSASELVSGSETKTVNGTYDVTNLAELIVNVASTASLKYETGSFTVASDTRYTSTANGISHTLGVTPKCVVVWQSTYDDVDVPTANLCAGYVYLDGLMSIPQRINASTSSPDGYYAYMYVAANDTKCYFNGPTSASYMPTSAYKPSSTKFALMDMGSSYRWQTNTQYHYFVSEGWWTS